MDNNKLEIRRQFILDTLLPYKQDRSTCAYDGVYCFYHTDDGRNCAVGKHLVNPEYYGHVTGDVYDLVRGKDIEKLFTNEAYNIMGEELEKWAAIQLYHDGLAAELSALTMNSRVDDLECVTGLSFPELRME